MNKIENFHWKPQIFDFTQSLNQLTLWINSFIKLKVNHSFVSWLTDSALKMQISKAAQTSRRFFIIIYCNKALRKKGKKSIKHFMQFYSASDICHPTVPSSPHNRDNLLTFRCHISHKIFTRCFGVVFSRYTRTRQTWKSIYLF